jgi:hypothetical protein
MKLASPRLPDELKQTNPTAPLGDKTGRLEKPNTHPRLLAEQAKTRFNRMTNTICAAT